MVSGSHDNGNNSYFHHIRRLQLIQMCDHTTHSKPDAKWDGGDLQKSSPARVVDILGSWQQVPAYQTWTVCKQQNRGWSAFTSTASFSVMYVAHTLRSSSPIGATILLTSNLSERLLTNSIHVTLRLLATHPDYMFRVVGYVPVLSMLGVTYRHMPLAPFPVTESKDYWKTMQE